MWIVLTLLAGALACDDLCAASCGLLNAPTACYVSCGCATEPVALPVSAESRREVQQWLAALTNANSCSVASFEACVASQDYSQVSNCLSGMNCKALTNFQTLVENIPSHLWSAIQPVLLTNTLTEGWTSQVYTQFTTCREGCKTEAETSFDVGTTEFFEVYTVCTNQCGIQLEDAQANCVNDCENQCVDDVPCLDNCTVLNCGVDFDSIIYSCGDMCFADCFVDGTEEKSCNEKCKKRCDGVESVESVDLSSSLEYFLGSGPVGNCGQVCFQICYVNFQMTANCYNPCMLQCEGISSEPEVQEKKKSIDLSSSLEYFLGSGPVGNCGQVCFQICYVNFQMTANCYNPCMLQCEGISVSEAGREEKVEDLAVEVTSEVKVMSSCSQECYLSCYNGETVNKQCYNYCISHCPDVEEVKAAPRLAKGNKVQTKEVKIKVEDTNSNCEWVCYHMSFVEGVPQEESYRACVAGNCPVVENNKQEAPVVGNACAQGCYTECLPEQVMNIGCYEECLASKCDTDNTEETELVLDNVKPLVLFLGANQVELASY